MSIMVRFNSPKESEAQIAVALQRTLGLCMKDARNASRWGWIKVEASEMGATIQTLNFRGATEITFRGFQEPDKSAAEKARDKLLAICAQDAVDVETSAPDEATFFETLTWGDIRALAYND